jgi:hypothetical protein
MKKGGTPKILKLLSTLSNSDGGNTLRKIQSSITYSNDNLGLCEKDILIANLPDL